MGGVETLKYEDFASCTLFNEIQFYAKRGALLFFLGFLDLRGTGMREEFRSC